MYDTESFEVISWKMSSVSWVEPLNAAFIKEIWSGRDWGESLEDQRLSYERFMLSTYATQLAIADCRNKPVSIFDDHKGCVAYRTAVAYFSTDDEKLQEEVLSLVYTTNLKLFLSSN